MASGEREGTDVVVIGGGLAGLAAGFYLRRAGLSYVILDAQERPGGAWLRGWDSLRLFSPAQWSSLPGWLFPGAPGRYPTRDEVVAYLEQYERRYELPVRRPVRVSAVHRAGDALAVETDAGTWAARAVVSATGSWQKPYVPDYQGREQFTGVQLHSAYYRSPEQFRGRRVLVVGGGNSGAQVFAEVSLVADATWVTLEEPRFLPDDVEEAKEWGADLIIVGSRGHTGLRRLLEGSVSHYVVGHAHCPVEVVHEKESKEEGDG